MAERSQQVSQMLKIYKTAGTVLIWIGPDTEDHQARIAKQSIETIANFLCRELDMSISDLDVIKKTYQEIVLSKREQLPLPNECQFSNDVIWKSLTWFYAHPYFTRVWAVQEITANKRRVVHCGHETLSWEQTDLVAGYLIMDAAFSMKYGFSNTNCWWVNSIAELASKPQDWLQTLYLASNYFSSDHRDVVYGLRGLMKFTRGAEMLEPDYSKSTIEVYRDSVEAAFIDYQNTHVLLYLTGNDDPSWVPRWNRAMLFRNPFRFGKPVPWKPAGNTTPEWSIDKEQNILSIQGFFLDTIESSEPFNAKYFCSAMLDSTDGQEVLKEAWRRILKALSERYSQVPVTLDILTSVAMSFAYGLDDRSEPITEYRAVRNFAAYLQIILDKESISKYIATSLLEDIQDADGRVFGKPV
ncbi:MAG: hypothetical protein MMC23_009567 [Stictis urceolatum]|nr:hypothetical protein [Stictis urceolata]